MPTDGEERGMPAQQTFASFGKRKVMKDDFSPLTVEEYAAQALTTDQRSDSGSLTFPLLGLFGETGSLLSEVKKKHRDRASYVGYAGAVVEELGDVLWYLTAVAARGGLTLTEIVANCPAGMAAVPQPGLGWAMVNLPPQLCGVP
jgi:NTP pyrophosphatase (non-canonical NTP hydrolase)